MFKKFDMALLWLDPRPHKRAVWIGVALVLTVAQMTWLTAQFWWFDKLVLFDRGEKLWNFEVFGYTVVVYFAVIGIIWQLKKIHPAFQWWIGKLIGKQKREHNLIELLLKIPILGWMFLLYLFLALPAMVAAEEFLFRDNLSLGWVMVISAVLFGLAHLIMGVELASAVGLMVVGGWFTVVCYGRGQDTAIIYHAAFDIVGLALAGSVMLFGIYKKYFPRLQTWYQRTTKQTSPQAL